MEDTNICLDFFHYESSISLVGHSQNIQSFHEKFLWHILSFFLHHVTCFNYVLYKKLV